MKISEKLLYLFHLIMTWSELNSFNYHTYIPFLWNRGGANIETFSYNSYYKKKSMYKKQHIEIFVVFEDEKEK